MPDVADGEAVDSPSSVMQVARRGDLLGGDPEQDPAVELGAGQDG